jgi:hypothetical protein
MMIYIIFLLAALLGALLLSAALVVWLWQLLLPLSIALMVVGVVYIVVAVAVYRWSIRGRVARWRSRLDVVYKVCAACDMVYQQVMAIFGKFFKGI